MFISRMNQYSYACLSKQCLIETMLLSGGTPYANFRDLAHAWGREMGFHHALTSTVCERRGEVDRKKRSELGKRKAQREAEEAESREKMEQLIAIENAASTLQCLPVSNPPQMMSVPQQQPTMHPGPSVMHPPVQQQQQQQQQQMHQVMHPPGPTTLHQPLHQNFQQIWQQSIQQSLQQNIQQNIQQNLQPQMQAGFQQLAHQTMHPPMHPPMQAQMQPTMQPQMQTVYQAPTQPPIHQAFQTNQQSPPPQGLQADGGNGHLIGL